MPGRVYEPNAITNIVVEGLEKLLELSTQVGTPDMQRHNAPQYNKFRKLLEDIKSRKLDISLKCRDE